MNTTKFQKKVFRYNPLDNSMPFHVKLQMHGRRMTFCTKRYVKEDAAIVAKEIYVHLHSHGWHSTIRKYGNKAAAFRREFRQKVIEQAIRAHVKADGKVHIQLARNLVVEARRNKPDRCEICGTNGDVEFDHCHKTGCGRGYLCHRCNVVLGLVHDERTLLRRMIE